MEGLKKIPFPHTFSSENLHKKKEHINNLIYGYYRFYLFLRFFGFDFQTIPLALSHWNIWNLDNVQVPLMQIYFDKLGSHLGTKSLKVNFTYKTV